jgi:hypothetical protein
MTLIRPETDWMISIGAAPNTVFVFDSQALAATSSPPMSASSDR